MQVELAELNRVLKPDAKVIISLKYATLVGLNGKPVGGDMTVYQHCANSGSLGAKLEVFEAGEDENSEPEEPKAKEDKKEDDDSTPIQAELESWDD